MPAAHLLRTFAVLFVVGFAAQVFAGVGFWSSTGPEEAWPSSFVFDPSDPTHVYMSTQGAGVFESRTGGASWTSASRGLPPSAFVGPMVLTSASPMTIYAPIGDTVYRTTDGGGTWSRRGTGLPSGAALYAIAAHPTNPLILIAATFNDAAPIYRTVDGGATWSAAISGLPASRAVSPVAADPLTPGRFAVQLASGTYVTTDSGATWTAVTDPLSGSGDPEVALLFDVGTLNVLHLVGTFSGGFRSTDAGATWAATTGATGSGIAVSPLASARLHRATFNGSQRSVDGGLTYADSNGGQAVIPSLSSFPDISAIAASPVDANLVLAGGVYAGVFRSTDGGVTWVTGNSGLKAGQNRAIAFDLSTTGYVYAATGDGGVRSRGMYRSIDNGLTWQPANNSLATSSTRAVTSDPNRVGHVYAGGVALDFSRQGVHKSVDSGDTWTTVDSGLPNISTVRAILVDPTPPVSGSDPATLYLGSSGGVFKSVDGATTWTTAGTGLPAFRASPEFYIVIALAMAPSNPQTLYAGISSISDPAALSGGVYKTTDGGGTWTQVNGAGATSLPDRSAFALAVDPGDADVVYAANSNLAGGGWVYKTTDGGASWVAADAGISVRDLRALLVDPANPDIVYAASGGSLGNPGGIFQTRDGGVTWNSISIGLLDTSATALTLDPMNSRRLIAGTRLAVNEIILPDDADADGAADATEAAAPNAGDGNEDLIPDSAQDNVASLRIQAIQKGSSGGTDPAEFVTVEVSGCAEIFDAHIDAVESVGNDEQFDYPNELISFELPNCETGTVTVIYHNVAGFPSGASFRTYAPTEPGDVSTLAWFDVPGAMASGNEWTFTLADGQLGDFRGDTGTVRFTGGAGELGDAIFEDGFE